MAILFMAMTRKPFSSIFARTFPAMFLLQASGLMIAKVYSMDRALLPSNGGDEDEL